MESPQGFVEEIETSELSFYEVLNNVNWGHLVKCLLFRTKIKSDMFMFHIYILLIFLLNTLINSYVITYFVAFFNEMPDVLLFLLSMYTVLTSQINF